ncbi:MAG TPA: CoA pyrophosphatase [Gammaproteobacteria bacterium]|nr:CoA pyrophosphatase [Gammaproteobacteria bacterium]
MSCMDCDEALRRSITRHLRDFTRQAVPDGQGQRAAVAVVVLDEAGGADLPGLEPPCADSARAALLLTRRSAQLRRHAGQWALPGGRLDAGEAPEEAALRELREEVGLRLGDTAILGRLDDYPTRSGFAITPVVVWGGRIRDLAPEPGEVASIHRIPVVEFLRPDAPLLDEGPDPARPVLRMPVADSWIAAPTAAVLLQFREVCLRGRQTRVAHFDQPAFAWR